MRYGIDSDGRTVWVNAHDGSCIGRFSKFGVDVHRTAEDQLKGMPQCLDCGKEETPRASWDRFVHSMMVHHGVVVGAEHMPDFVRD